MEYVSMNVAFGYMVGSYIFQPSSPWPLWLKFLQVGLALLVGFLWQQYAA